MDVDSFRADVHRFFGASQAASDQLLAYGQNAFAQPPSPQNWDISPEPHIAAWQAYQAETLGQGVFPVLQQKLVQLRFPIQLGISEADSYRAATRRGISVEGMAEATGLHLEHPEGLQLQIHPSLAGPIPVLIPACREDFVTLVRALTMRNEPKPVPDSMGACIVAGFNNWDRVGTYRQYWQAQHPELNPERDWAAEFQRLIPRKELYQDRFILLSLGPYSNVSASQLDLGEKEWLDFSLTVRLEHESTHYLTRRLLGSMRNNVLDELIADYRGIVSVLGHFRADWFLHFVGLENYPYYREGGRLQNYRGQPPLSDEAFQVLQAMVKAAAEHLEAFDRQQAESLSSAAAQIRLILALTALSLEALACTEARDHLQQAWDRTPEIPSPDSGPQLVGSFSSG
ncbi:hypothetical protein L1047_15125 [Synechococcus sp. Nb3U1]|uniref:DUF7005 family protein n=1 Tax=Synechococcus sp. Nb3U1 TaxID=1914529 RepID=UPI001F41D32C|nr:hypothetical protein [Synechococcus sp. Nb3U1]MCF2972526.1 hypothetical protein [Synechococcus sp. Nb3U1]